MFLGSHDDAACRECSHVNSRYHDCGGPLLPLPDSDVVIILLSSLSTASGSRKNRRDCNVETHHVVKLTIVRITSSACCAFLLSTASRSQEQARLRCSGSFADKPDFSKGPSQQTSAREGPLGSQRSKQLRGCHVQSCGSSSVRLRDAISKCNSPGTRRQRC